MKVVDAVWEKRNLGIDTVEVEIEVGDTEEQVREVLNSVSAPYSVIKVPTELGCMIRVVQEMGYRYAETSFALSGKIKDMIVPKAYIRYCNVLETTIADEDLTARVLSEVGSGHIFATDRIALDPMFSQVIAGKRYANWIGDEIKRGAKIYISNYKGMPVSFTVMKGLEDGVYHSFLGGVFEDAANKGFGFSGLLAIYDVVKQNEGKKILTHVSSNNMPMLRLHMSFGYDIVGAESVFIKHQ